MIALVTMMLMLCHVRADWVWAATLVPGGTEKLGDGVKDAAKTAETGLIGYFGPIASVLAGLIAALATRSAGGSNAGAAASGVAAAALVAFIPVAGITTYSTSGSEAAGFTAGTAASGEIPINGDMFSALLTVVFFGLISGYRRDGGLIRDCQVANRG